MQSFFINGGLFVLDGDGMLGAVILTLTAADA
jgi:hypothetical protein